MVSDLESELLLAQPASRNMATVHRDFRLWLILSAEAIASLPGEELPTIVSQIGGGWYLCCADPALSFCPSCTDSALHACFLGPVPGAGPCLDQQHGASPARTECTIPNQDAASGPPTWPPAIPAALWNEAAGTQGPLVRDPIHLAQSLSKHCAFSTS